MTQHTKSFLMPEFTLKPAEVFLSFDILYIPATRTDQMMMMLTRQLIILTSSERERCRHNTLSRQELKLPIERRLIKNLPASSKQIKHIRYRDRGCS